MPAHIHVPFLLCGRHVSLAPVGRLVYNQYQYTYIAIGAQGGYNLITCIGALEVKYKVT